MAWGAAAALLMFSFSFLLYRYSSRTAFCAASLALAALPESLASLLLLTMASRRWLVRALACVVMLAVLVWVWHRVQPPWWDNAADVAEMQDNQRTGSGYEGTDEYVPNGADAYEIKKDAHHVSFRGRRQFANSHYRSGRPSRKSFTRDSEPTGQAGAEVVQLSGVEGGGEWPSGSNRNARGHRPDDHSGRGGRKSGPESFSRAPGTGHIGGFISFGTGILLLGGMLFRRRAIAFRKTLKR